MEVKLFNSLSNQMEVFKPIHENKVSIYICGPTVYGYVHIGNMRPVISFDVLRRMFMYLGYEVSYTTNITDVDDKIINAAKQEGISEKEVAKKYADYFFWAYQEVNALPPTNIPTVTQNMDGIIAFINDLIQKGFAYAIDGDVYFRVGKIASYGRLGNFKVEDLKVGARIEENEKKENPLDFALWKKTSEGIQFPSPWSLGRPGWHTECVVMINGLYEEGLIDIHGGGFDLKFPHHENEIAQSIACHNHSLAHYWLHNGFVNIDNEKMSKSLGNVRRANDIIKQYGGNAVRLTMMNSHYRAPINFSNDILEANVKESQRIGHTIKQGEIKLALEGLQPTTQPDSILIERFLSFVADDLNTANGIMVLNEAIKELNMSIRQNKMDRLAQLIKTIYDMLFVLGLKFEPYVLSQEEQKLFGLWETYKKNKDFTNADIIRNILISKDLV